MSTGNEIQVIEVASLPYDRKLCAAALQGIVNRDDPRVFLDYGIYDDPAARRTNEVFLDDGIWFGKYREMIGNQDRRNLEYYRAEHGMTASAPVDLETLVRRHASALKGCVVWDPGFPDTANIAIMLAAQRSLLPVSSIMTDWATGLGLPVVENLCGRFADRVELYSWCFKHLFPGSREGVIACVEPGWQRPEFADYLVQQGIFTYSLAGSAKNPGSVLLLLLAFGPAWLRETIYALRLDAPLRRLGLKLMGWKSAEARLANTIQRSVKASPYPTIYGWHTCRDDELSFMLQLSANGLRLVPSHIAGNFSFHGSVRPLGSEPAAMPPMPAPDPDGVYCTFTLSDGDQLMMMNTGELGNWHCRSRGGIAFNWEVQPLLAEIAPALLEKYRRSATPNDCLIAGPSGAGYVVPPLVPDLPAYLRETSRICGRAGINVVTSYVADPPRRVVKHLVRHKGGLLGYLCGYATIHRSPRTLYRDTVLIANQSPAVSEIAFSADDLLESVRRLIEKPGPHPRFIGIHLFAYRTGIDDVAAFLRRLNNPHVHVVRADVFLMAAREYLNGNPEWRAQS